MGMAEHTGKHFLSFYWGGAMTGRFLGAIALRREFSAAKRAFLMLALGAGLFALLFGINQGHDLHLWNAWPMAVMIAGNAAAFMLAGPVPARALGLFALAAMALLGVVMAGAGAWAMWAIVAIGLFNSIMWSNIFTLAIDGLNEDTAQGSSLLVMMIMGGALIPPLQGALIDAMEQHMGIANGFHLSFALPLLCYAFLGWYGFIGSRRAVRS